MSYNNLGTFLNYIVEFELLNSDLEQLYLSYCELNDEQLINMASSRGGENISSLETIDISNNVIGNGFVLLMR